VLTSQNTVRMVSDHISQSSLNGFSSGDRRELFCVNFLGEDVRQRWRPSLVSQRKHCMEEMALVTETKGRGGKSANAHEGNLSG